MSEYQEGYRSVDPLNPTEGERVAYRSVDPQTAPETLPSQNPAYTSGDGSGSGSSGSTTTTDSTIVQNVDGKLVTGYATQNGGFMSNDGTVYVPPGGSPEYGITDPVTGNFLQGGTTRIIEGQTAYGTVQNGTFVSEDGTMLQLPNGFVEHGKTDATGNFLAETTVDGQQVWGNYGDNGDFMSADGKIYVPAGKAAEYGITDPSTGNFLPGGSTRVIDGQTVYGTVQNGIFVSEDGTMLQLPNDFVEHGKTDASGNFLAETTVNGQQVWGNYADNGDFMSSDGTIYVPSGKAAEFGITDPGTGNFLQGGTTRVIDGQTVYGTVQNGIFVSEDGTMLQLPSGFVEHGKTDASGNFLAETTVNGQQVWGNYADNGDFMSADGTIYVPAGKAAEFGITDPGTGNFLENGTTRVIDGKTVYGTALSNGDFISEDGTLLQMPSGFVEHGYTDSNNDFVAQMTIDGKLVSGNYGDNGSFMSLDGTIYVPPGGTPEYGVTDPKTNSFLPNGTTYTLPDGTVLYGYKEPDGSFWSYDGSEIILSNGTAVTGTLQKGDGIFTGSNGNFYFVGTNGITQVTPNKDGSFSMPDGSVVMTPQSWKTDLQDFQNAQTQIGTYISSISDDYSTIQMQYSMIESFWSSPAGTSFTEATSAVDLAMQKLNTVLSSITTAMQTSYSNYYASEQQAITTFNNANSPTPS